MNIGPGFLQLPEQLSLLYLSPLKFRFASIAHPSLHIFPDSKGQWLSSLAPGNVESYKSTGRLSNQPHQDQAPHIESNKYSSPLSTSSRSVRQIGSEHERRCEEVSKPARERSQWSSKGQVEREDREDGQKGTNLLLFLLFFLTHDLGRSHCSPVQSRLYSRLPRTHTAKAHHC